MTEVATANLDHANLINMLPIAAMMKTEAMAYMRKGEHPISLYIATEAQYTGRTEREVLVEMVLGKPFSRDLERRLAAGSVPL